MPTLILDPDVLYVADAAPVNEDPSLSIPGVIITSHTVALSTSATFSFRLPSQYMETVLNNTGHPAHLDKTVLRQIDGVVLFKGLVKNHSGMTLTSESVNFVCEACENFIDSQEWLRAWDYYNTPGLLCNEREWKVTGENYRLPKLSDFLSAEIDPEEVEGGIKFFSDIIYPDSIGNLPMPALTTLKKGFFSVFLEAIAPYQHIKWHIEYNSDTALFPCGKLILRDMSEKAVYPQSSFDLYTAMVGGESGKVLDLAADYDISETCEKTRIFARGRLVERYEVLTPSWASSDESIYVLSEKIGAPLDPKDNIQLPPNATFVTDLNLWIHGISNYSLLDSNIAAAGRLRLWQGADYRVNVETGEIEFMRLEDDSSFGWWWVDDETGQVYTDGSSPQNFGGSNLRRPIAYENVHATPGVYYECEYTHIGRMAYRKYKTRWPIMDFRLVRSTIPDPNDNTLTVNVLAQSPTSFEAYIPKVAAQRFNIDQDTTVNSFGDIFAEPGEDDRNVWQVGLNKANTALSDGIETVQELEENEKFKADYDEENTRRKDFGLPDLPLLPRIKANLLFPAGVSTAINRDDVTRFYVESSGGAQFEEGGNCVILSTPQLMALPEWYDTPNASPLGVNDPFSIAWMTWTVVAHYTSWTQYVVEKPSPSGYGKGRVYRGMVPSIFQYTDATKSSGPEVIFDNLLDIDGVADATAEYFGNPAWHGSVGLALDISSGSPVIPVALGDVLVIDGKCLPPIKGLTSVVVQIDYSSVDEAKISVTFGKTAPPKNPFVSRKTPGLVLEGESGSVGSSGLQDV